MTDIQMSRRRLLGTAAIAFACAAMPINLASAQQGDPLAAQISASHRSPGNVARDKFRKPYEILKFFGVNENSRAVEILPGSGGYFTEILAPYLRDKGLYITAGRHDAAPQNYQDDHKRMLDKYAANPAAFGKIHVTKFFKNEHEIAPPGSMDFVLTFRNLHNWIERNEIEGALKAFHTALKPGGIFGVTDHRGRMDMSQEVLHTITKSLPRSGHRGKHGVAAKGRNIRCAQHRAHRRRKPECFVRMPAIGAEGGIVLIIAKRDQFQSNTRLPKISTKNSNCR